MNSYTQDKLARDHAKGITFRVFGLRHLCWYLDTTGGTVKDLFGSDSKYASYQSRFPDPEKTSGEFNEFCQRIDQWCDRQWSKYENRLNNCGYYNGSIVNTLSVFKQIIEGLPWTDKYMLVEEKPSKLLYDYKTIASSKESANLIAATGYFGDWQRAHCVAETLEFVWIEKELEFRPAPCLERSWTKFVPIKDFGKNNVFASKNVETHTHWECLTDFY